MELLFEPKLEIVKVAGQLNFFQRTPDVSPEPVLVGDSLVDGGGALIYGTVLHDEGRYRMWYQATPKGGREFPSSFVGYAESDDGIEWRKPTLNMVDYNGKENNLCNLGVHCASVFVDPDAPSDSRYRATGHIDFRWGPFHDDATPNGGFGYYTAHSADGLDWKLDSPTPRWRYADCIYNVYHPARRSAQVMMKIVRRTGGLARRTWWEAKMQDGEWSDLTPSLIPDAFTDVAALARGYASSDYYGLGLLPVGRATVGFVQRFRQNLPRVVAPVGSEFGKLGVIDLSLAYQIDEGAPWIHAPWHDDFVAHSQIPWATRIVYCASSVVECGDEQRLYIGCTPESHGVPPLGGGDRSERIGYASWPKWRLFGYHADPRGELGIDLGSVSEPSELVLNYEAAAGGSIRVEISTLDEHRRIEVDPSVEIKGRTFVDAVPMVGDSIGEVAQWKDGSVIQPVEGQRFFAHLSIERAKIYAYQLRATGR